MIISLIKGKGYPNMSDPMGKCPSSPSATQNCHLHFYADDTGSSLANLLSASDTFQNLCYHKNYFKVHNIYKYPSYSPHSSFMLIKLKLLTVAGC